MRGKNPDFMRFDLMRSGVAMLCVAAGATLAAAQSGGDTPRVMVNGNPVNFTGQPPVEQSGRVLVPLRGVLEKLGAYVQYDASSKTVTALQNDRKITLPIGSRQATIDGRSVSLDVPATVINGSTMVPLRFVAESLGANVNYDSASNTVAIAGTGGGAYSTASSNALPGGTQNEHYNYGNNGRHDNDRGAANTVVGRVVAVYADGTPRRIVIRPMGAAQSGAPDRTIRLLPDVAIQMHRENGTDETVGLSRVELGDRVRVQVNDNGAARAIDVLHNGGSDNNDNGGAAPAPNTIRARFTGFSRINNGMYEVRMNDGRTINIPDTAPILLNGSSIGIADLRPGDRMTITVNPDTGRGTRILVDAR